MRVTSGQPTTKNNGWSWGAFILEGFFLIAIKKYIYLLLFLLYFVPIVNIFAMIGVRIFLGIKGRQMAYESRTFANRTEADGFMKGVDYAGKVMFFVTLILIAVGIFFALTVGNVLRQKNRKVMEKNKMLEQKNRMLEQKYQQNPSYNQNFK